MKKIIIYFGDQTDKQAVVEQVLDQLNADYRVLQDHGLGQRVGTLLGLLPPPTHITALTSCCLKKQRMRIFCS